MPTSHDYTLDATGLVAKEDWSRERWEAIGFQLGKWRQSTSWAVGDWLLYGETKGKWGQLFVAAEAITGLSRVQLARMHKVAQAYPREVRNDSPPWTFWLVALSSEPGRRLKHLQHAADSKMTLDEFTAMLRRDGMRVSPTRAGGNHRYVKCPHCGEKFLAKKHWVKESRLNVVGPRTATGS